MNKEFKKKKIDASSSEEEKKWQEKRVELIGTSSNRLMAMATRNAALSLSSLIFLYSLLLLSPSRCVCNKVRLCHCYVC
jgi:hypothetical protein